MPDTLDTKKILEKNFLYDDEPIEIHIPDKDLELIPSTDVAIEDQGDILDKDIDAVLKLVKDELTKSIPIQIKDNKAIISDVWINEIDKKTQLITSLYMKRYILKRLNMLLFSLYKLARGYKKDVLDKRGNLETVDVPPDRQSIKDLIEILRDSSLEKIKDEMSSNSSPKMKLSEILQDKSNGKISTKIRVVEQK